jgi:hypothetical protein
MDFTGFDPEDFQAFVDRSLSARVEYIRDVLHPRMRALGEALARRLAEKTGVELRCQLRSGRWHRNPWATWVSVITPTEPERSDPSRPRLSVFLDPEEVIAGFCQTLWRPRWKKVARRASQLANVISSAGKQGKLDIAIAHWGDEGRTTLKYRTAGRALAAAAELGQDFFIVGRNYLWPDTQRLLCSRRFLDEAAAVFEAAWPVYHFAFFGEKA